MPAFPFLRRFAAIAALLCLSITTAPVHAQTKPSRTEIGIDNARSFLWVGNSFFYFNNSLHSHVGSLARGADPKNLLRGVSVTISGSGMDWHDMASYLRPDGIGRYSFLEDNSIRFNPPGRQFDGVIMMDCSQCPVHPQLGKVFHEQVKKNSEMVSKYGARPILFMSWAYKDKPEMTAQLAEQYTTAANANDALVIPAGLAFARAIGKRPEVELYNADKRHPSLEGSYLAACTAFATLTRKSPVGNPYTAGLPSDVASFLQTMAWEAVQDYQAK